MPSSGERLRQVQAAHRQRNFERVMTYLTAHPCVDRGESDPIVLDFDHLPGREKRFEIARAVGASTRSWTSIANEIAKCEVVCANCHRRRTAARGAQRKHLISTGREVPVVEVTIAARPQVPHGGGAKGRRGCDCIPCRDRRRQYNREWRAARRRSDDSAH